MLNKQHINGEKRQHHCNKSATVVNCYKLSLQTAQLCFRLTTVKQQSLVEQKEHQADA